MKLPEWTKEKTGYGYTDRNGYADRDGYGGGYYGITVGDGCGSGMGFGGFGYCYSYGGGEGELNKEDIV